MAETCSSCGETAAMLFAGQCRACIIDDFDEPDSDDGPEFEFDCGMMPDGTCMLAGTEECDWECPRHA